MKIGVIGLGNMGSGMAATLASKGEQVYGYDLSTQALEAIATKGVTPIHSLEEFTALCNVIILSLPKAEHVEQLCLADNGLLALGHAGLTIIDTTNI